MLRFVLVDQLFLMCAIFLMSAVMTLWSPHAGFWKWDWKSLINHVQTELLNSLKIQWSRGTTMNNCSLLVWLCTKVEWTVIKKFFPYLKDLSFIIEKWMIISPNGMGQKNILNVTLLVLYSRLEIVWKSFESILHYPWWLNQCFYFFVVFL